MTKITQIGYVPLDIEGGTMTGALILHADPVSDLQAATKQYVDNSGGGGGSGDSVKRTITTANGFNVGDAVYLNGSTYTLAQADDIATAEVVGVVETADASEFTIVTDGFIDLTGASYAPLTPGDVMFLSTTDEGELTDVEPTNNGEIWKPVLIADSATSGYVRSFTGVKIGSGGGSLITKASATNAAFLELVNVFSASTPNVLIKINQLIPSVNNVTFQGQVGIGAAPTWQTDNYKGSGAYFTSAGTSGYSSSTSLMTLCFAGRFGNSDMERGSSIIRVFSPFGDKNKVITTETTMFDNTAGNRGKANSFLSFNSTDPITSIRFQFSSGNITADAAVYALT